MVRKERLKGRLRTRKGQPARASYPFHLSRWAIPSSPAQERSRFGDVPSQEPDIGVVVCALMDLQAIFLDPPMRVAPSPNPSLAFLAKLRLGAKILRLRWRDR